MRWRQNLKSVLEARGNIEKNRAVVVRLEEIAAEKKITAAQLALAWVLAQGDDIVPIFGSKRRKYFDENLGALNVKLNSDDLRRINEISSPEMIHGERYSAANLARINKSKG
jgi:aryl-alcohol dehydrogenase-like predicted oxidoreductase